MTSRGTSLRGSAVATICLLLLAGCSGGGDATGDAAAATSDSDVAAVSSPGAADDAAVTSEADPQTRYLTALRTLPAAADKSDEELLEIGGEICDQLDKGKSIEDMAVAAQSIKDPAERELGAGQIAVAIPTLCPQHLPDLARFAEEQKAKQTS